MPDDICNELQAYVAHKLGEDDEVLIIDDTGFIEKGTTSAGVQRQYSGAAGRTENCQIGVFAAYATARGRPLVDRELDIPKSWAEGRERCRAAKLPDDREFATKGEPARHMVLRALGSPLPVTWVTADSAYGQESRCWELLVGTGGDRRTSTCKHAATPTTASQRRSEAGRLGACSGTESSTRGLPPPVAVPSNRGAVKEISMRIIGAGATAGTRSRRPPPSRQPRSDRP